MVRVVDCLWEIRISYELIKEFIGLNIVLRKLLVDGEWSIY